MVAINMGKGPQMDNNHDLSIMYSGGLDSFIAYNYAKKHGFNPICIWVDLGHPYSKKETDSMNKFLNSLDTVDKPNLVMLDMKSLYPSIQHRLKNQIIPARNLLLATVGAMFSPRVWINALNGEQNGKEHDKSERFFEDSTKLLSFLNEFFQSKTLIQSPFMDMSKTEIVTWALENGIKKEHLLSTTSCYSENSQKCGKCLTCFKRYTAFLMNDIHEEGYETNPLESDYFKELLVEIPKAKTNKDYSRFTEHRINEFDEILKKIRSTDEAHKAAC